MQLTSEQEQLLQSYLIEQQRKFQDLLSTISLPTHLCLHLAPDMCYISLEHEYHKDYIEVQGNQGDEVTVCERRSPACHEIICKV